MAAHHPFPPSGWLPPGKACAVIFSVDDVHPAGSGDGFDAGGDLGGGALGRLLWLIERHPKLRTTLSVTPDWRPRSPLPNPELAWHAQNSFLADTWPEGRMRLDRHPRFVAFLKSMPRIEVVPHGLHHMQRGPRVAIEFERTSYAQCRTALERAADIFARSGLPTPRGQVAPGWAAPPPLRQAMRDLGLRFIASARDLMTPITPSAVTAMSGLHGQPLIAPGLTDEGLVHIPTNFQATSPAHRALAILDAGGLLSIKAHIVKSVGSYVALDAIDGPYAEDLDRLLNRIEDCHGDEIWWASMEDIAERVATASADGVAVA